MTAIVVMLGWGFNFVEAEGFEFCFELGLGHWIYYYLFAGWVIYRLMDK